jgi:hypothetical protein
MSNDIYLSYSRRDFEFVAELYQYLTKKGFSVWFDKESISPGEDWSVSTAQGIRECKIFLLILSPDAAANVNIRKELSLAQRHNKQIVPLIWRPTEIPVEMEYQLAGIQWIDFAEDATPEKLNDLVVILHRLLGTEPISEAKAVVAQPAVESAVQNIFVQQQIERISDAEPANIQKIAASQIEMLRIYYREVLDQAQKSFRWAIIAAGTGLIFFLGAVIFTLVQGTQNIAVVSLISGSLIEVISAINFYLYGKTSSQLADFQNRLDTTQRILLANSMCEGLEGEIKHQTRSEIIKTILSGDSFGIKKLEVEKASR